MAWRATPADRLLITPLSDGLTLIFDRQSGQTHLVASPVPEIIAAMGNNIWTTAALLDQLHHQFDLGADVDLAARLDNHLGDLKALGLVEQLVERAP